MRDVVSSLLGIRDMIRQQPEEPALFAIAGSSQLVDMLVWYSYMFINDKV